MAAVLVSSPVTNNPSLHRPVLRRRKAEVFLRDLFMPLTPGSLPSPPISDYFHRAMEELDQVPESSEPTSEPQIEPEATSSQQVHRSISMDAIHYRATIRSYDRCTVLVRVLSNLAADEQDERVNNEGEHPPPYIRLFPLPTFSLSLSRIHFLSQSSTFTNYPPLQQNAKIASNAPPETLVLALAFALLFTAYIGSAWRKCHRCECAANGWRPYRLRRCR
jgi:hypothetical protein